VQENAFEELDDDAMKPWESLIDQKIREAMEQGEFDNLSGQGKPIDLSVNPFEDPDWRTAHRLLRNAGFAPGWIEELKDIDVELGVARRELQRARLVLKNARGTEHQSSGEARWGKALGAFRNKVADLNRRIRAWNLKAPSVGFHRTGIDAEREIDQIKD
jgi:DnaJ homolog subfamily C member 28